MNKDKQQKNGRNKRMNGQPPIQLFSFIFASRKSKSNEDRSSNFEKRRHNLCFNQKIEKPSDSNLKKNKKESQDFKGSPIIYNNRVSSCKVYPESPSSSRKKKAKS